jgi:hypothetical protein
VVTGYTGTIHFTSTNSTATLPANYTFTAADKGVHTFTGLVLRKQGNQKITITDTLNSSLTASVIENVPSGGTAGVPARPAGKTTKTLAIVVNGASKKEANESCYLDLFGNSSSSPITKRRGSAAILNDD